MLPTRLSRHLGMHRELRSSRTSTGVPQDSPGTASQGKQDPVLVGREISACKEISRSWSSTKALW